MLGLLFLSVFTAWKTSTERWCWSISHTMLMAQNVPLRPPPFLHRVTTALERWTGRFLRSDSFHLILICTVRRLCLCMTAHHALGCKWSRIIYLSSSFDRFFLPGILPGKTLRTSSECNISAKRLENNNNEHQTLNIKQWKSCDWGQSFNHWEIYQLLIN